MGRKRGTKCLNQTTTPTDNALKRYDVEDSMFDFLKNLVGEQSPVERTKIDDRVALAALLVEAALQDDAYEPAEKVAIERVLRARPDGRIWAGQRCVKSAAPEGGNRAGRFRWYLPLYEGDQGRSSF